jgi:PAS domain S-box-containing protein
MLVKFIKKRVWKFLKGNKSEALIHKQSHLFLESILENIPAMVFIKDAKDLRFKLFNKAGEELLGFKREDLIEKNDYDFFSKEQADFFTLKDRQVLKENVVLDIPEESVTTKYKGIRWLHTKKIPLLSTEGTPQYLLGISLDVTEKKIATDQIKKFNEELEQRVKDRTIELEKLNQTLLNEISKRSEAETAVKVSEERYKFLANAIPQMVWTLDTEGNIDYLNKYAYDYTGLTFDFLKGWSWMNIIHPMDYEQTLIKLNQSLVSGDPYEAEIRFKRFDGNYLWFLSRAIAMKDASGKILKWFGSSTEIHEHKLALEKIARVKEDIEKVNYELSIKNEKLTKVNMDLDNFVYTASHDLKAPVTNIEGLMNMLSLSIKENNEEENNAILEMIRNSIKRFQKTIKDLTEISKIQKDLYEDIKEIDVAKHIKEVKFSIENLIKESDALVIVNTEKNPVIRFSEVNFNSLVHNLLTNAIKYKYPGRRPIIEIITYQKDIYFVLEVKDNGLGIDESHISKIFTMFKRLHDHVEGTGVGLYIVKRIVENSGGKIEVESKVGKGTIFKLYLKMF